MAEGDQDGPNVPVVPGFGVTSEEIREQLERILASPGFRNSERLRRFLRATVGAALAGKAEQLKEYALGRDVFDRGADYDPRTDSIVRVEAQRLRRKLRQFYEQAGPEDAVSIALHAGSYVPEFSRIRVEQRPADLPLDPRTVAVLPFSNLSAEPEQEYFCDGITEDIINALTTVSDLKVLGRASMFAMRDAPADPREIGRKLGAGTIVEGSVRQSAGVLRISAKLVNAETRLALWSGAFDRSLSEVFAIEDEIAGAIVGTLRVKLGFASTPPLRERVPNLDAYRLYLKGRQAANRLDPPGFENAVRLFSRALSLYPDYAPAYADLADLYASSALLSMMRPVEAMPRAKRAALEALRLDARTASALAVLGWVTFFYDRQWEQGLALTRRAAALAPSYAFAHFAQGACLAILARFEEALRCFEQAAQLDPLSLRVIRGLGWTLAASGREADAEQRLRMGVSIAPDSAEPYYLLALVYLQQRRVAEALDCIRRGHRSTLTPLARGLEGAILAAAGEREQALAIMTNLRDSEEWVDPIVFSRIHLELGDAASALKYLASSIEERSPIALYAPTDPLFARLRQDRHFREIIARLKLPAALTTPR